MWSLSSLPKSTVVQCGVAAIISVFLVSWLRIRPLGLFFFASFGLWYYKTRCNLRIIPPPELQKKMEQLSEKLRDLRQNKPTMFCLISAGCLCVLAIVGHMLSGSTVVLIGLILAAILSTKYNFKIIKIEQNDFAWIDRIHHDPEYDDEFLPEVNERNRSVLERAGDLASLSSPTEEITNGEDDEEKSDEIPSELLIPDPIPEVNETYDDDELEHDLMPIIKKEKVEAVEAVRAISQNPKADRIEFKKAHFKRGTSLSSSSSSSEESLSKGLQFPDHTAVDGPTLQRLAAAPNKQESDHPIALALTDTFIPSLVSGFIQWGRFAGAGDDANVGAGDGAGAVANPAVNEATAESSSKCRVVTALDSSDDSDFEILDMEDLD